MTTDRIPLDDLTSDLYTRAEAATERARDLAALRPEALGERPVPVRLHILDTMRAIAAALHDTVDQLASSTQRPAMRPAPPA
ncbi:hypothetical protein AB0933_13315 [Streptomyces venezuelae]|uniref:hypothetical protein n=1 Tax=Streptomyces venezuelae TaxID=54571 RepID=UPI0034511B75